MGSSDREAVDRRSTWAPPRGVKLYCGATVVGALLVVTLSLSASSALFAGALVVGALHLASVYGLWNAYLLGVDLALALNAVALLAGLVAGDVLVVALPALFAAYLLSVRDRYR